MTMGNHSGRNSCNQSTINSFIFGLQGRAKTNSHVTSFNQSIAQNSANEKISWIGRIKVIKESVMPTSSAQARVNPRPKGANGSTNKRNRGAKAMG